MRCPYCAEEIQDAAIVCRFCGAEKSGARWERPRARERSGPRITGVGFTMKFAAAGFVGSALLELFSLTSPVPLFGALRTGAPAVLLHLLFAGLFAALAVGLWLPKAWGARAVYAGTALYTLDKALYALDRTAREAEIMKAVGGNKEVFSVVGKGSLLQLGVTSAVLMIACWWGFAAYVYFNRKYFEP